MVPGIGGKTFVVQVRSISACGIWKGLTKWCDSFVSSTPCYDLLQIWQEAWEWEGRGCEVGVHATGSWNPIVCSTAAKAN